MPQLSSQTPNWQPLSKLPLLAHMIAQALAEAQEQLQNLRQVQNRPYVLDNYTAGRVNQVFGEQREFLGVYQEQLARWKAQHLNNTQTQEISRLERQLEHLQTIVDAILSLADELKAGTMEKVQSKSDLEVGRDILLGKLKL